MDVRVLIQVKESWRQELKEATEEASLHSLRILLFYILQDKLPRGGIIHNGQSSPHQLLILKYELAHR